jgi:Acetyltransferase (GNAT) family
MMHTDDLTVYLGEINAEPVATAALLVMPHLTYECAPTAFIEAVVVVPEHRRKGFATGVVQRALGDARELGCNKVQLLSHKRHAADGAHGLYEKLGFEPEAEGFRLYLQQVPPVVQPPRPGSPATAAPVRLACPVLEDGCGVDFEDNDGSRWEPV